MSELNVLISSAGRRVALLELFRRSLRDLGVRGRVLATDLTRCSSAFQAADLGIQVPPIRDEGFVPAMLDLCHRHGVGLVVPTIDTELQKLSEHREAFSELGAAVAISGPETIAIGGDKRRTHAWLTEAGFPTVRQAELADAASLGFPLLVKPVRGSSSVGVAVVRDRPELELAARGSDVVVQTIAPGEEFTVDAYVDRSGRCACAVPRKRLATRAGEVSKGLTVREPRLEELATRIAEALPGAYGALNVQIFWDGADELNVIELNPRFGGGYPLSWEAGARFPTWLIEEALGRACSASNQWRAGVLMLRYDDAVFRDASEWEL